MFGVPKFGSLCSYGGTRAFDLGLRQKKLAETQKLETMYSSLLEKFNNEETIFEAKIQWVMGRCFFPPHFFAKKGPGSDQTSPDKVFTFQLY